MKCKCGKPLSLEDLKINSHIKDAQGQRCLASVECECGREYAASIGEKDFVPMNDPE